ncbi:MAG: ornithine cyclodeaminase family protein [Lachnospiraceae bacterium]
MSYPINVRVISKSEVESLVTPEDVIEAVDETFKAMGNGQIYHPVKEPMWMGKENANMLLAMPAHVKDKKIVGVKWVNMFTFQEEGIPSSYGNILLLSREENGQPYAVIEATSITTMRTAGGHGVVAAKYLAKKSSEVLAVVGCGAEGLSGIRGFLAAFPGLKKLRVCDKNHMALENVKKEFKDRIQIEAFTDAKEAVEPADIVLLVTTARKPVVMFEWLKKGAFVSGLYSFNDLDPECSRKADKWYLGSKDTDYHQIIKAPRLADYHLSMDNVKGDLGEVAAGRCAGRENDNEIIIYTHMGMGALDIAVGDLVYRRAVEQNVGKIIDLA